MMGTFVKKEFIDIYTALNIELNYDSYKVNYFESPDTIRRK